MEKKKCGQCGLVNWPGVMECVRCGAFVTDRPSTVGRNPYEGAESKGSNRVWLGGLLVVAAVGSLIAYSAFPTSTPPKAGAATVNTGTGQSGSEPGNANPADGQQIKALGPAEVQKLMQKDIERMDKARSDMEKQAEAMKSFRDFKLTPEQMANARKSACAQGVKNMGPC